MNTPRPAVSLSQDGVASAVHSVVRPTSVNQWRFVRAYATTFTVIASYSWFEVPGALLRSGVARRPRR